MKISMLLLMIGTIQIMASPGYAQRTEMSFKMEDVTVKQVLDEIESNSEFYFLYSSKMIDVDRKVSIKVRNDKIDRILADLFQGEDVRHYIVDRQIILSPENLVREEVISKIQQQSEVSGTVTDAQTGEPLPGVNIVVRGTTHGTTTNVNGEYSIEAPGDASLVFSFVGYQQKTVKIGARQVVDVALEQAVTELQEVVAIGYGSQKKSDVTGAISSVSSEDVEKTTSISLEQSLQGRVAGAQVVKQSGKPGGGISVQIRGPGSVLGGTQPLYVVDGFPISSSNDILSSGFSEDENALSFLNPGNIQSIEILKGASATAIYGSRGANGVVLITTKTGREGRTQVQLNVSTGFQQVSKKLDLLNTSQMEWIRQQYEGDAYEPLPEPYAGTDINWQDQVFRQGFTQDYGLSISGGNKKTQFMFSGNFVDQEGIVISSGYQKASANLNLDHSINDYIQIKNNLVASRSQWDGVYTDSWHGGSDGSILQTALSMPPYFPKEDESGNLMFYQDFPVYDIERRLFRNPIAIAEGLENNKVYDRFMDNLSLNLQVTDNLVFKTTAGIDYANVGIDLLEGTKYRIYAKDERIRARKVNRKRINWVNENTLTYTNTFNEVHDLTLLGGFTQQSETYETSSLEGLGFPNDKLETYAMNLAEERFIDSYKQKWDLLSWLGRINYSFDDKYLITASVRADGSSKFGKNSKWGVFPSAALAWRVIQEDFMQQQDFMSNLKFRVSYGVTGNQEIGTYRSIRRLGSETVAWNNQMVPAIYLADLPYEDLTWEETKQFNVGVDMGFLKNNRISLEVNYFKKATEDMLINLPQPMVTGVASLTRNAGSLENTGWEFAVRSNNLTGEFKWVTSANLSTLNNEITDLAGLEEYTMTSYVALTPGQPLGALYGYKTDGLWQMSEQAEAESYGYQPGDLKFVDLNDDGEITPADKTFIGSPFPDIQWGLTNTFAYKGFELSVFLRGQHGNEVFFPERALNGLYTNGFEKVMDAWRPDNQDTNIPRWEETIKHEPHTRNVRDASFVRLQNIRLAYTLPSGLVSWLQDGTQIYLNVDNLHVWTDYPGFDPEVNTAGSNSNAVYGFDDLSYPKARTLTLGVRAKF